MPIHDLGYRSWDGKLTSTRLRWSVVSESGIRMAWKSRWLRRMLLLAWMPALYMGIAFFAYEFLVNVAEDLAGPQAAWPRGFFEQLPVPPELAERMSQDPASARSEVWSFLMWVFFRTPQAAVIVLVVGLVAPPLIARDVRSRAFLLYFSRPITRTEYLLGKACTVWFYLLLVATVPALVLYGVALLLSPSLSVVVDTWHLPLRILGASAVLAIPTTAVALCLSSLATETRYATFGWFAIWVLGWVCVAATAGAREISPLVSLYHVLGRVQSWIFGFESRTEEVLPSLVLLALVTLLSGIVLYRRVSAPLRV